MSEEEPAMQKKLWLTYGSADTSDDMFLHNEGKAFDLLDHSEILDALGDISGKRVLELGSGNSRFTGSLAKAAKHVISTNLNETYTKQNQETNGHLSNITFLTVDVTKMDLGHCSHDLVFANWLLQYLSDDEVKSLFVHILAALTEGGVFFFRESCHPGITNFECDIKAMQFRDIAAYFKFIEKARYKDPDGKLFKFKLNKSACVKAFVITKNTHSQIYWNLTKVETNEEAPKEPDFDFYANNFVKPAQKIYGEGFISPGGIEGITDFLKNLALSPGQSVLDIGSGYGAVDFLLANSQEVNVSGIDITPKMFIRSIQAACNGERSLEKGKVFFILDDCENCEIEENTFDAIMSFSCILHIKEKGNLFKRIFNWLKPGGQLLISDFCKKPGEISDSFIAENKLRSFHMVSVKEYGEFIKQAGFVDVTVEDITESMFIPSLKKDLVKAQGMKEEIIQDCGEKDYHWIIARWNEKLMRTMEGEMKLGLFKAKKPSI